MVLLLVDCSKRIFAEIRTDVERHGSADVIVVRKQERSNCGQSMHEPKYKKAHSCTWIVNLSLTCMCVSIDIHITWNTWWQTKKFSFQKGMHDPFYYLQNDDPQKKIKKWIISDY